MQTRSIPLERITNVSVRQPGTGACNQCIKDVGRLAALRLIAAVTLICVFSHVGN